MQSVITVPEQIRKGCRARHPSPKKSRSFRTPTVASFPFFDPTLHPSFPLLDLEHRVSRIPLNKDPLLFVKVATIRPWSMVESKAWGSNLPPWLAAGSGVMVGFLFLLL